MMTLLITGGMGFIGSHVVRLCLQAFPNCRIINLDKLTYAGNPNNLNDCKTNSGYVELTPKTTGGASCDIADSSLIRFILSKYNVDGIIHLAAESHVDRSIDDAYPFIQSNIVGTHVLIEVAKKMGVTRFVHVSTDEVYGSVKEGFATECSPVSPTSQYSASKLASDELALSFWRTHKFPVIVTRCTNNYGSYQHPEKFIPLFITNLLENKKVPLYGAGVNIRDWMYVEDHVKGIIKVFQEGIPGEVYNLCGGNQLTNLDVTKRILAQLNLAESMIEFVPDRKGHDLRYAIDDTKIRRTLGWKPEISFDQGIKKTINWYTQNQAWWKPLKGG